MTTLSPEQQLALEAVASGRSVFLTGPGGTGKSFAVNAILAETGRDARMTASTGIAASHIGGCTVHSYLGTGLAGTIEEAAKVTPFSEPRLRARFRSTELLVLDEISMLSGEYLDMMDHWMRRYGVHPDLPFGGVQLLITGDFLQLPPVQRGTKRKPLKQFAFDADAWAGAEFETHQLTRSFRQADQAFVDALNDLRLGHATPHMTRTFEPCVQRKLLDPTYLVGRNKTARIINAQRLARLCVEQKQSPVSYRAETWGTTTFAVDGIRKHCLADENLTLAPGAPVLLLTNDRAGRWVNGTRGTVTDASLGKLIVDIDGYSYQVEPHTWEMRDGDGHQAATLRQLPVKPAWAITIHKAQGMSLDNVLVHNRGGEIFDSGQLYVALSRARRLEGLSLTQPIRAAQVSAHPRAVEFYTNQKRN